MSGTHSRIDNSDMSSGIRTIPDEETSKIPPTTSASLNTENQVRQRKGSISRLLSRRFTSKQLRVRNDTNTNTAVVRGDDFMLFVLEWVPHTAVLMNMLFMAAMAFMQAPTSNPREDEAWVSRPIQWGETQNMWMPFYSLFAMLMTLLFFHSFVRITIVAEVHRTHSTHKPSHAHNACA